MHSPMNPMQVYFENDNYIVKISRTPRLESQHFANYSPKTLIKGYWKKNYTQLPPLKNENQQLLPVVIKSYSQDAPPKFRDGIKFTEKPLDISNSFGSLTNRQSCTDTKIRKLENKVKALLMEKKLKEQEQRNKKKHGKLFKGFLLRDINFETRLGDSFQVSNNTLFIKEQPKKELKKSSLLKMNQQASKDRSISLQPIVKGYADRHNNEIQETHQEPMNFPKVLTRQHTQRNMFTKQTCLDNKHSLLQFITIPAQPIECIYTRGTQISSQNILIIQFEGILGYDESSYFGLQVDFLESPIYDEYLKLRHHGYQPTSTFSSLYAMKSMKDIFKSLSRAYQIVLMTYKYATTLIEYIHDRKIPVTAVMQIKEVQKSLVLDIEQVTQALQIKTAQKVVFIQPFELKTHQSIHPPDSTCRHSSYEYYGQRFYFPFVSQDTNIRMLALPQISMNDLYQRAYGHDFTQTGNLIQQMAFGLVNDTEFTVVLNKHQHKIRVLRFNEFLKQQKQNVQWKLAQLNTIDNDEIKQEAEIVNKKQLISRIVNSFENQPSKIEQITTEIVQKNKKILKRISKQTKPMKSNYEQIKQEMQDLLKVISYCEQFHEFCYFLSL